MVSEDNKRVAITLSKKVYKIYKETSIASGARLSEVIDYALNEYAKDRLSKDEILFLVNK